MTEVLPEGFTVERFDVTGAAFPMNPIRGDVDGYRAFLETTSFDVVLMNAWQTWSTDVCLVNLARIKGRKILYSHGLATNIFLRPTPLRSALRYLLWRPYALRLPAMLKAIDAMFVLAPSGCDSRFDDLRLAQRLDVPVRVIPNALPAYALDEGGEPQGLSSRRYLLSVGAYHWSKGHDFVLRAYAASGAKNRIPLRFFGQEETPEIGRLRSLAGKLGVLAEYVSFGVGVSGERLIEEYRGAVALLSGSHTECQPLVLLDALATGTPFVARATGCIDSLPGGYAVRSETEAAAALDEWLASQAAWTEMSRAGRVAAMTRYHPEVVGGQLWNAICEQVPR